MAYFIPSELLVDNISASLPTLQSEGLYPSLYGDGLADNFTVAAMLNEAGYSYGNPFETSLLIPLDMASNQIEGLEESLTMPPNCYWSRYWGGFSRLPKALAGLS